MSATTSSGARRPAQPASGRSAKRPLKSPLAALSGVSTSPVPSPDDGARSGGIALSDRHATLAEFEDYLRTVNNRDGRPYEQRTIVSYVGPGKNLDGWMTATGIDGDFTALDAATLNRYFREYYLAHGQGGPTRSSGT